MSFRALLTEKDAAGTIVSSVRLLEETHLPQGNVTVDIEWAGFNYKDGLCLTGGGALVRTYPHVAGIDFAGTVRASGDARYAAGDRVVLTGWRVGETHWGGYAERARVNADWLVPLPQGLTTRDAMVVGTAGLSAMFAITQLEAAGMVPKADEILVTGAAGGVGTIATLLLARLGYAVAALSGRPQHSEMLRALGASSIVERADFLAQPDKPLESARWAGGIDTVGGKVLGKMLRQIHYGGAVASIGNAGGNSFETSVLPFILRRISLLGVDSGIRPYGERITAWQRIAGIFDSTTYNGLVHEIGLEELPAAAAEILAGKIRGRIVVKPAT